jgi:NitT/TauT family transport system ATP-binding protein
MPSGLDHEVDPMSPAPTGNVSGAGPTSGVRTPAMVEIRGVQHRFVGSSDVADVVALRDIDLVAETGSFVSLIGPSGCGKSTLLRLVADLMSPTEGDIRVNGKTARLAREGREYGMVFQAPVLFDWRSIERNIALPLEVLGIDRAERTERVRRALRMVELDDFARHDPWQLSGGMQQRVAIARALVLRPALLLMDEPFGALDEMTRERMNMELHRIWEETGTTVVFVTHSIQEAVFLSTKVVVMSPRPGTIVDVIEIDLPRARDVETREMDRFFELVTEVRESLRKVELQGRPDEAGMAFGATA